jgi:superfamily II DNA/RNA helicase
MGQSIVFIATKRDAEALATRLQGQGHAAAALHGDMNQRERTRTLQDMRAVAYAHWSRPTSRARA